MEEFEMPKFNNFEDLQTNIDKAINSLHKWRGKHIDNRTKEIGDRVKVWDGSYNKDYHTEISRQGVSLLFKQEAIVIETNCKEQLHIGTISNGEETEEITETLDLLLVFANGTKIYCASECVKRIDQD